MCVSCPSAPSDESPQWRGQLGSRVGVKDARSQASRDYASGDDRRPMIDPNVGLSPGWIADGDGPGAQAVVSTYGVDEPASEEGVSRKSWFGEGHYDDRRRVGRED